MLRVLGGAMRVHRLYVSALFFTALGCQSGASPAPAEPSGGRPAPTDPGGPAPTGLEGIAYRGPTRPVCQVNNPCNAPFSAGFEVRQGERVVARFQSDSAGRFEVSLPPGSYTVVADASAPLLARAQVHDVTVNPNGLTHVELNFDTGIR